MGFPFKDVNKCRLTCIYGKKGSWKSGKHDGVDLVSDGDKTVLAVSEGKVIRAGWNDSWGQYVVITMADGRSIVYAHMVKGSLKVSVGDFVKVGQALGTMGNTGHSTGAHLHIELQKNYYKSGAVDDITKFLGIENKVGKVQKKELEEMEKQKIEYVLPDGKIFIDTEAINLNGSIKGTTRPLLEALGFKVGWVNKRVTINK